MSNTKKEGKYAQIRGEINSILGQYPNQYTVKDLALKFGVSQYFINQISDQISGIKKSNRGRKPKPKESKSNLFFSWKNYPNGVV